MGKVSKKRIERLTIYRKILKRLIYEGIPNVFSKSLAQMANCSPEQVRSDLMVIGYSGSPANGYSVSELEVSIGVYIDEPNGLNIALVIENQLGVSLMEYAYWLYPNVNEIVAFCDNSIKDKIDSKITMNIFSYEEMSKIIKEKQIEVAILASSGNDAQKVADTLVESGIKGIINNTPVHINVPDTIFIEDHDLILALDKLAFFIKNDKEK